MANNETTKNTLPAHSNIRRVEVQVEAMALHMIVEEIMTEEACVVYSNDDSAQSGMGNCCSVFKHQWCSKKFSYFWNIHIKRETLPDLVKCTIQILSAASAYKYSTSDKLKKITFVMSDSTAHNLQVMEKVCEDEGVENNPLVLLCNIHPLMMFQKKIKEFCHELHDMIGKNRIKECFLVDTDFDSESFVIKSIRCLSNFIFERYSAKPWNRCNQFGEHIKPKKNMAISLKDHRFNRLQNCCLSLMYHLDDIADYLNANATITNDIDILDRSFIEMGLLKPIYGAIAFLGLHITKPFRTLLIDPSTRYSTLMVSFKRIYKDVMP